MITSFNFIKPKKLKIVYWFLLIFRERYILLFGSVKLFIVSVLVTIDSCRQLRKDISNWGSSKDAGIYEG